MRKRARSMNAPKSIGRGGRDAIQNRSRRVGELRTSSRLRDNPAAARPAFAALIGAGAGEPRTVTFPARDQPAAVMAFAPAFIDTEHPGISPSNLGAKGRRGKPPGDPKVIEGAIAS